MNLTFMTPLILSGLGLLLIPWLIHRIQRPERRPVAFSSLLFIPRMDKEVVRRRKLQHLLLLLLRMALLAILAFAFARPFLPSMARAPLPGRVQEAHVLLIDQSYSMGAGQAMAEAREKALAIVESLPAGEPVAVVSFAATPRVLQSFNPAADRSPNRAEVSAALRSVDVLQEATRFQPALLEALRLLEGMGADGDRMRGVIHLVSDLQSAGFPDDRSGAWRLDPGIELRPVSVGPEAAPNRSLSDVVVRSLPEGRVRVSAKVRNRTMESGTSFPVKLYLGDQLEASSDMTVPMHHASQVTFELDRVAGRPLGGWIEIGDDALAIDNRRYFEWEPPVQREIHLLDANAGGEAMTSAWFVRAAFVRATGDPFRVQDLAPEEFKLRAAEFGELGEIVIAGEIDGSDAQLMQALHRFLGNGGRAILTLDPSASSEILNSSLLKSWGVRAAPSAPSSEAPAAYRLLDAIDFTHPVFAPFQAPQYNDFSMIRVSRFMHLDPISETEAADASTRILARLEKQGDDAPPALLEVTEGRGSALVWTFPHDPRATSLPKSTRYAPIMLESIRYLIRDAGSRTEFQVGEVWVPPAGSGAFSLRDATGNQKELESGSSGTPKMQLDAAGILSFTETSTGETRTVAVNVDASEGDLLRLTEEEVRLRLMAPELPEGNARVSGIQHGAGGAPGSGVELGLALLVAAALLLGVEFWYAPRLVP